VRPPSRATVGEAVLRDLAQGGTAYLEADQRELARLTAIYDAIVAVEQADLQVGRDVLTHADLVAHLRTSGYISSCQLFVKAAELSPLFGRLLFGSEPNEAPPQQ
jgi:hypothetical protein